MSLKSSNVAIVFGKDEDNSFNRYTFPVLGRPVSSYPLLAALHSQKIDDVYLSSDSPGLIEIGKNTSGINLLIRKKSRPTLTEEVRHAVRKVFKQSGRWPELVVLMLANSPCVTSENIDVALTILEDNKNYDSVVSTMMRTEFDPMRVFSLRNNTLVREGHFKELKSRDVYFIDRRIIVIRASTVLSTEINDDNFESLLGERIYPLIQNEGIWDIDYIWQVPIVERWLKDNGFGESDTPYKEPLREKGGSAGPYVSGKKRKRDKMRVLVTTVPFGQFDDSPIKMLTKEPGVEFVINPKGRKLKESELPKIIKDCDIIIAGTEKYSREVLASADRLKLISRVGIGLDSIDLQAARDLGIIVSYTPDAPSPAVAELTIGLMFSLLRQIPLIDRKLRSGIWQRISGERLSNMVIGIIGTGRVGSRILKHLQGFHPKRIFVNDIHPDHNLYEMYHAELVEKETIYEKADIITLHVPLTPLTQGLIGKKELDTMKPNTRLINTSRGGIIDENALYNALIDKRIAGAAIDVYENEPYTGNLIELRNNVLTCHMGSMTKDCRKNMEIQAAEEAIRFIRSEPLKNIVPESEYHIGNESYRSNKSVHAANSCGKRTAPLHEMT